LFLLAFVFFLLAGLPKFKEIFVKSISLGMLPASIYGLIQFFGLDWVNWSNTDQLFSVFGNTNFAASIFGITAASSLCVLVFEGTRSKWAPIYISQATLSAFLSWQTQSIQGVIMLGLVILLFVYAKVTSAFNLPRILSLSTLGILGTAGLMGFVGRGPLDFLYQYTFELRSYYWEIGLRMGMNSPIFGVGIDSYGDFYRQFRSLDVAQVTSVDLTVNNAHNSLIQVFATTGIFGIVAVLCWLVPALIFAVKTLYNRVKSDADLVMPILFLGSFAISMISIDNIAVAILHWAITGVVVRLYVSERIPEVFAVKKISGLKSGNPEVLKPILLPALVGIAFIFVWLASSADRNLIQVFNTPTSTSDSSSIANRVQSLREISDTRAFLQETQIGYISEGIYKADVWPVAYEVAKAGIEKFPNDFNLLDRAAMIAERLGKFNEAEDYRTKQLEIDPRHPKVMLYLARDLMEQGKIAEAKATTSKSYEFDVLLDTAGRDYRKNLEDTLKAKSD
jgi:O-antigen ligase